MQIFRSAFVVGNQRSGTALRSTQWTSLAAWKRSLIDRFCLPCASGFTTHCVPTRLIWKMTRKTVLMSTFYFPKLDFCLLTYFFLVFNALIPFISYQCSETKCSGWIWGDKCSHWLVSCDWKGHWVTAEGSGRWSALWVPDWMNPDRLYCPLLSIPPGRVCYTFWLAALSL